MWQNFINWRNTNGIDTICQTIEFPEREKVKEIYP